MEENAMAVEELVGDEPEEFTESFVCCVCLDLLYKPIVLSCGHVSCFWCVHRSMNSVRESRCPICRHSYHHFPTICQMLHFLLLMMYPIAYKRRENETLEEEKKLGFYSPQFDADACGSQAKFDHPGSSSSCSIINLGSNSIDVGSSTHMEQSGSIIHKEDNDTIHSQHTSEGTPEVIGTLPLEGKNSPQNKHHEQQKISVADVMCTTCKQLLFHPVVLNCGHVYCETCIINLADEMLRCQVCQSPHPRGYPKVCLELDHFLEKQFPEEYAQRRDTIQLTQIKVNPETPSSCLLDKNKDGENLPWWSDPHSKVHIRVGCDFCGMFPIIGDRYKCKDCKEEVGFDLCGDCYNTRSKLPGRFNQQHTSQHKFELVQTNTIRNIMVRLVTGQLGDSFIDNQSLENLEFRSEDPNLFDDREDSQDDPEASN